VSSHRFVTAVLAAGCVALGCAAAAVTAAGAASADPTEDPVPTAADTKFTEAFNQLGIPVAPDQNIPALGRQVCDIMTSGLKGQINPVPAVRGTVSTLESNGLTKPQAVTLLRMSVATYCPQYGRYIGR